MEVLVPKGSRGWRRGTDATAKTMLSTQAPRSWSAPQRSCGRWHSRGRRGRTYWPATCRLGSRRRHERETRKSLPTSDDAKTSQGCRRARPRTAKANRNRKQLAAGISGEASTTADAYLEREHRKRAQADRIVVFVFLSTALHKLKLKPARKRLREAMGAVRRVDDSILVTVGKPRPNRNTERESEQLSRSRNPVYSETGFIQIHFLRGDWIIWR